MSAPLLGILRLFWIQETQLARRENPVLLTKFPTGYAF